jgi:5-formyltetrahydrofolate cyclo-ligase
MRQLFRCLEGAAIARRRDRQLTVWAAWHTANFTNAKKLPDLQQVLRKLEPAESRVMSPKAQRSTILGLAAAFGAEIVYRKKGEAVQ